MNVANNDLQRVVPLVGTWSCTLGKTGLQLGPIARLDSRHTRETRSAAQRAATMGVDRKYSLLTQDALTPPPNRGRLWYDDEIPEQFFRGRVSVRWVRAHLPRAKGIKIGRDWAWYESDIIAWFESQRGAAREIS